MENEKISSHSIEMLLTRLIALEERKLEEETKWRKREEEWRKTQDKWFKYDMEWKKKIEKLCTTKETNKRKDEDKESTKSKILKISATRHHKMLTDTDLQSHIEATNKNNLLNENDNLESSQDTCINKKLESSVRDNENSALNTCPQQSLTQVP